MTAMSDTKRTDTPRTDAATVDVISGEFGKEDVLDSYGNHVPADFARTLERELAEAMRDKAELREALGHLLGPIDDEKVGWRGLNPPSNEHFGCEFCAKSHLDCTLIEHLDDCPVTIARATLEKTK